MSAADWGVLLGGIALIALINWYFFFSSSEGAVVTVAASGIAEIPIVVRGGYSPGTVRVPRGARVRLVFDRQEESSCSEEVVFPDFGIRRFLPAHEKTVVELTPEQAGSFGFTCGMSMLRGTLVVEEGRS
ncbi:MAG TPA: cupredoxin domain-containing protein [Gemmatimonadaceae bacterium]|nr:cupredoxin domain-containing protein [Gemmatimonadaceae bacterium]